MQEDSCKLWEELGERFCWVSDTFAEILQAYLNSNQAIKGSLQQLLALQTDLPAYVMDCLQDYDQDAAEWRHQAEDANRSLLDLIAPLETTLASTLENAQEEVSQVKVAVASLTQVLGGVSTIPQLTCDLEGHA